MMKCQCICRHFCLNKSNNLIMKKLPYWRFTIYNQISVKRVSTQSCHVSNFKRLLKFVPYLKKASPKRNCGRLQSVSIQRERYRNQSTLTPIATPTPTATHIFPYLYTSISTAVAISIAITSIFDFNLVVSTKSIIKLTYQTIQFILLVILSLF